MSIVSSIASEYGRYKQLGERAIAQVADEHISMPGPNESSSIAIIVWHIAGNLRSRFTDVLTTDGEKPWRERDEEFVERTVRRAELLDKWESGWSVLTAALASLSDADLERTIAIRGQSMFVYEALHRSLSHTAYHVGQIVYLAKAHVGGDWHSLSIPKGQSKTFRPDLR